MSQTLNQALDPGRSVVVEACAGSGKTWLLVSRILRLLLAGVTPGAILAITFTRKAAREIEERVVEGLRYLATVSDAEATAFLAARGVNADADILYVARGLYETVLTAQPPLTVNTFHGWFLRLVDAAPLSAHLAGTALVEFDSRVFGDLWQSFAAERAKQPDSEATRAFVGLLDVAGQESARRLMRRAHDRRSEWLAMAAAVGKDDAAFAEHLVGALREQLGVGEPGEALCAFFADDWESEFQAYQSLLEAGGANAQKQAKPLRALLSSRASLDNAALFEGICHVFLTQDGSLRKHFGSTPLIKRHARLGARVVACREKQWAERHLAFNRHACLAFAAFLAHVEAFKRAQRQIDFTDAEWRVLRLLRDSETAAFLQARLDARYKHVLLDEFQDTSPLQWQILRAWFDAYSDADRPRVFLVGDPKQSIYRFRRAEPRLFAVAADFLQREFAAVRCEQDATRRNAPAIIDVVNTLFDTPEFTPFRAHVSLAAALPGRVELLPLVAHPQMDAAHPAREEGFSVLSGISSVEATPKRKALRDPLTEADVEPEDLRRQKEAALLAAKISEIVGNGQEDAWQIEVRGADAPTFRAARYGDFMLLVRSRAHLSCYERALAAAGIAFDAGSRGGLLDALEVRDIVALLEFLVTPADGLALAHTLRAPLFACSNEDLIALATQVAHEEEGMDRMKNAREKGAAWWPSLLALAQSGSASPPLARAARLVSDWQRVAGQLPAHDLIDRIYHQGEVLARYRLATPEAAAPAVEANLRRLPLLALDLDSGRYPSLPRFIDALRELREADANDAPDEGRIETDDDARADDAGRVRILTIHGAKGLEAPIVWLLGANNKAHGPDAWDTLVDWPPEAAAPCHFSFTGRREDRTRVLEPLFETEAAAARREELNLLYVAITRARQVFIASGIEGRKQEGTPYHRLKAALEKLDGPGALAHGDFLPRVKRPATTPAPKALSRDAALPSIGERKPETADARFGILLHALLEHRTQNPEDKTTGKVPGFSESEYRNVQPVAERLLRAPHLRRFFAPEYFRRAWNEVDLVNNEGTLLRIDRLVEFDDALWVLDYKSSGRDTPRLAEYEAQVVAYCRAVSAAFKRDVRGALVFADAELVEVRTTL